VNLVDFGAFIDLGGVEGLVHRSELDWQSFHYPSDVLNIGDRVEVLVTAVDIERGRIQLSRKALLPSPWDQFEQEFIPGDLVEVEISNVVNFGAFGKFPSGIDGLIHETEMGYSSPVNSQNQVNIGDRVLVKILNIDRNSERVALSMQEVPLEKQTEWALKLDSDNESETADQDSLIDKPDEV
jgi:ribosomal protein S1